MQETSFFAQMKPTAALCLLLLLLVHQVGQVTSGPLVPPSSDHRPGSHSVPALRRKARMTPLWRIMKPFGAYCQNNYECSTGLCRAGHCSTSHRPPSEPVND